MRTHRWTWLMGALCALIGCGDGSADPPVGTERAWRMGFSALPPRLTTEAVLEGISRWSPRAEMAILQEELPWKDLISGMTPDAILDQRFRDLVALYRSKGFGVVFIGDLTDGLSRGEEASELRALGRSLTEPAIQKLQRDYMAAVARRLKPDYIGLAAETNLIRAAAPAAVYQAVVQAANSTAAELKAQGVTAPLFVSIQVEAAWGRLQGSGYVGLEQDFEDFAFTQALGLSSYPYLAFDEPEDLPDDYYSRPLRGRKLPVMVVEGGWSSASVPGFASSPEEQARYIRRQAKLLESVPALAWFQFEFADLDLSAYPKPLPQNLPLFASLELVGSNWEAKPALAEWDAVFRRPLKK